MVARRVRRQTFIVAIITIPGTSDALLLEDYWEGPKVFANLSRVREDGTVVWRAAPPLPTSSDSWTQARVEGTEVTAYSWSGFLVRLDLESGQEISREFVK